MIDDCKRLEKCKPCFPLTWDTFLNTVTQAFGDPAIKELGSIITESKEQLENCRTYINMMNVKQLSANELFQLASIINQCKKKSEQSETDLSRVVDSIKNLSEDSFSFVWDKIDKKHYSVSAITLPHITADQEKPQVEKDYNDRKVRGVHYRKQQLKILKEWDTGMRKVVAYCADKDFPLECFQIPRNFPHYEVLNQFYNQIGASKQLMKSKYVSSYLGFDDMGDPDHNLYFFQILKGKALEQLLQSTG